MSNFAGAYILCETQQQEALDKLSASAAMYGGGMTSDFDATSLQWLVHPLAKVLIQVPGDMSPCSDVIRPYARRVCIKTVCCVSGEYEFRQTGRETRSVSGVLRSNYTNRELCANVVAPNTPNP